MTSGHEWVGLDAGEGVPRWAVGGAPHALPAHPFPLWPTTPPHLSTPPQPNCQIVSVDEHGLGIKRIRPKSLLDMLKVRLIRLLPLCGVQLSARPTAPLARRVPDCSAFFEAEGTCAAAAAAAVTSTGRSLLGRTTSQPPPPLTAAPARSSLCSPCSLHPRRLPATASPRRMTSRPRRARCAAPPPSCRAGATRASS